ncbi:hypothetical protein G4O51_07600 [Candidatus Bathyarchaeota archaeon A05DMB-2]|nr:hypothetical protein [Candidatus Bathyarchaeota archaeon A05DMB-2]
MASFLLLRTSAMYVVNPNKSVKEPAGKCGNLDIVQHLQHLRVQNKNIRGVESNVSQ